MIVYGTKSSELIRQNLTDKCQNCATVNSIDMYIFQKYAHIFWIPFFPIGKTGVSQCSNCKQIFKMKEMPSSLKASYEHFKLQSKTPVWMFSGLALVALLTLSGMVSNKNNQDKNAQLILVPISGDIFEIKTNQNQYTLYKVDRVKDDSVFLLVNGYETNLISGLTDLKNKGDSAYMEGALGSTKATIKRMLDKGNIIDIDRK